MESPLIIANWKMQLAPQEAYALAEKIAQAAPKYKGAEVVVCPSFTELAMVSEILKDTGVHIGAQDCFWDDEGAFTGEVSPKVLQEYGVTHVIIGHSERRQLLGGTDAMINKKIRMLLSLNMIPVLCIGETFEQRQDGEKEHVLMREIQKDLDGVWFTALNKLIIAYEPIWCIGTGQEMDAEELSHTTQVIRQSLYDLLPDTLVDEQIKIIYGGSVTPENCTEPLQDPLISGALIGGASLEHTSFSTVITKSLKHTR